MAESQFLIPDEFQDQLNYFEPSDKRSDTEILDSLSKNVPVTSEKNIWAYWHAGLHAMPTWCQRNVISWVRINPGWTIRVLDTVPDSPNHALKFIAPDMLPESFVKGTMDGPYKGQHSADFLRGALLYLYGGVFMDVGIILIRPMDRICWAQLEDPDSPFQMSAPNMYGTVLANHFVASRKGDPFIKRWHDLFMYLWKDRTNYSGMIQNPLLSFALTMDFSESERRGYNWEFIVEPLTVFEYITQVTSFLRLSMLEDAGDGFSGVDYALNNILWFDVLPEDWAAETVVGFRGEDAVNALATKLNADPESAAYKTAYKMVWRLLTKSSMQKITHGKHLTKTPAWGLIWDEKGNENKDIEPGTFAELLRYGTLHFEQTRKSIEYVQPERPAQTMKKGVFEP
ncbi:hypothetical protein BP6252_11224 [Coleophoma cylindrospora]|uniref:Capsule polysaccharide biosynthesis protein n=1 Tax=Coleophoma cylindrospora TaxID=1849047 RepID=A0A3D8QPE8_9HELO|nr:hypothetical protein BP6252_11224 [Coleophoma cylindrospora]